MGITGDLGMVQAVLERDRVWSAFALADLTEEHRSFCEWHVADSALVLVYRGYTPPIFFALGHVEDVMSLLGEIPGDEQFYISVRDGLPERLVTVGYRFEDLKAMYRMVLPAGSGAIERDARVQRLGPRDCAQLVRLFADGDAAGERPMFFQESSLNSGVYFGVCEDGELAAVAGTLVFAPEQSVACIGNVYTRRDRRARGLASVVTGAVAGELRRLGIATIALNVRSDNRGAVRVYERLGFTRYCGYWEGLMKKDDSS